MKIKQQQSGKNKTWIILIALIAALALGGCSNNTTKSEPQQQPEPTTNHASEDTANSDQLVQQFDVLLQQAGNLPQAFDFMREHVSELTTEALSQMLFTLENAQIKELTGLIDRYYEGSLQEEIISIYAINDTLDELIEKANDHPSLKSLLIETRDSGYMLSTVEGMFNPDIDYSIVLDWAKQGTEDTKAYFELKAEESKQASLRDAALTISWEELLHRALAAEQFTMKYSDSPKIKEVTSIRDNYILSIFYGANNTPLFSYDTKTMDSEAQTAYESALNETNENANSAILTNLKTFMTAAAKENYKLTDALTKVRDELVISAQ